MCWLVSFWLSINFIFLVFLNFWKISLFIWLFVLMSVVLMIVKELFFLKYWVVVKSFLGIFIVLILILFDIVLFVFLIYLLNVCVKWVIEFRSRKMFLFILVKCLYCLMINCEIWIWFLIFLFKLFVMILLLMFWCMLVIFLGCLLINNMINFMFG